MIDAREDVLASAASRRKTGRVSSTRSGSGKSSRKAPRVERVFSEPKVHPFDQLEWDRRTAEITDDAGKVIFKQENVEIPKAW